MLVVTSNDISGYQIRAVFGEVFGVTVRARNVGAGFTAGLRSIGGGEIPEMTQLLLQSRNEAMGRMIHQAMVRAGRMPHQQQYATNVSEFGPRASH
jgi:uncharacterized protein YbjQ (UPF0145 family)